MAQAQTIMSLKRHACTCQTRWFTREVPWKPVCLVKAISVVAYRATSRSPPLVSTVLAVCAAGAALHKAKAGCEASDSKPPESRTDNLVPWKARWEANQTSWHLPGTNPFLQRYLRELLPLPAAPVAPGMGPRVLVPLCGKAVDMVFLSREGCRVLGV